MDSALLVPPASGKSSSICENHNRSFADKVYRTCKLLQTNLFRRHYTTVDVRLFHSRASTSQPDHNSTSLRRLHRIPRKVQHGKASNSSALRKAKDLHRFPDSSSRSRSRFLCRACGIHFFRRSKTEVAPSDHKEDMVRHGIELGMDAGRSNAPSSKSDHRNVEEAEMLPKEGWYPCHTNSDTTQDRQITWSCILGISSKIPYEALQSMAHS
ncbi:hypothetical protein E4U54_000198 [Claviceps lovelessii]|nr:hypothetical protein E4U54_000198 [Claviceps lovelessii]